MPALIAMIAVTTATAALPARASQPDGNGCDAVCREDLTAARVATAPYRDVNAAIADGFTPSDDCEPSSDGATGISYLSMVRLDTRTAAAEPEGLVYMPEGIGLSQRRLAAVDYAVLVTSGGIPYTGADAPTPTEVDPPPSLFGRTFDGPSRATTTDPWLYHLRVWLWSDNPAGLFALANRDDACRSSDLQPRDMELNDCLEVNGIVSADPDDIRRVAGVPDHYALAIRPDGVGQLLVAAFSCEDVRIDSHAIGAVNFVELAPLIESPFGYRDDICCSRYLWKLATDHEAFAGAWRRATTLTPTSDDVAYDPDLQIRFTPVVGTTDPSYAVDVPVYGLRMRSVTTDQPPLELPASVHIFRDTPRGTFHFQARLDALRLSPTSTTLQAASASELSALVGQEARTPGVTVTWDVAVSRVDKERPRPGQGHRNNQEGT